MFCFKKSLFEKFGKFSAFGSLDCPDVEDDIPPVDEVTDLRPFVGKNKVQFTSIKVFSHAYI